MLIAEKSHTISPRASSYSFIPARNAIIRINVIRPTNRKEERGKGETKGLIRYSSKLTNSNFFFFTRRPTHTSSLSLIHNLPAGRYRLASQSVRSFLSLLLFSFFFFSLGFVADRCIQMSFARPWNRKVIELRGPARGTLKSLNQRRRVSPRLASSLASPNLNLPRWSRRVSWWLHTYALPHWGCYEVSRPFDPFVGRWTGRWSVENSRRSFLFFFCFFLFGNWNSYFSRGRGEINSFQHGKEYITIGGETEAVRICCFEDLLFPSKGCKNILRTQVFELIVFMEICFYGDKGRMK